MCPVPNELVSLEQQIRQLLHARLQSQDPNELVSFGE